MKRLAAVIISSLALAAAVFCFYPADAVARGYHHVSHAVEREAISDAQLLEIMVQSGDTDDPDIGVATYYSSRFNGRPTASGAVYHPEKLTAAHAELPLGTLATVENLANGRKIMVLVNDRCRKRSFQLIDLSKAAAVEIGLWGKGGTRARITPVREKNPLDDLLDVKAEG